jgi:MYXO-CTERM domain-containing protein
VKRIAVVLALLAASRVRADSTGISGYAGDRNQTCGNCHSGGTAPMRVTITGPTTIEAGQMATYQIDVVSGATVQRFAGIDVAASAGTLAVHAGSTSTKLLNGEITHTQPVGAAATVSFSFDFTAPAQPQCLTLFGDGLSADHDGTANGDKSATTRLMVSVIAAGGDPDAGACGSLPDAATVDAVTGATPMSQEQAGEPRWGCGCEIGSAARPTGGWWISVLAFAGLTRFRTKRARTR